MPLVLGFGAIFTGAVLAIAGVTNSSIASVVKGKPDKGGPTPATPQPATTSPGSAVEQKATSSPPSTASSGKGGFAASAGANYSKVKPELVSRLDALAKHLGVTLTGISGYRTPQHSVEVGGFADDPHTRGEASDTEGTQSIPKAVLNAFGLERPFPEAKERDHIELLHAVTSFGGY